VTFISHQDWKRPCNSPLSQDSPLTPQVSICRCSQGKRDLEGLTSAIYKWGVANASPGITPHADRASGSPPLACAASTLSLRLRPPFYGCSHVRKAPACADERYRCERRRSRCPCTLPINAHKTSYSGH
jgi:hypothetical protein